MPVWHETWKDRVAKGELVLLGVIQEQHAERCRLFAQWKQMHWPILHDPINLLGLRAVPLFVAVDPYGVVRAINPRPQQLEDQFLKATFQPPQGQQSVHCNPVRDVAQLQHRARTSSNGADWIRLGDAIVLWSPQQIDQAIEAYQNALKQDSRQAAAHFRLGVAYRMRYDSPSRQVGDFQKAVDHWAAALALDPNHYIWRRRIQQYGPRLIKPYPFYDWVETARQEIQARGEEPVPLAVPLSGAEVAFPSRSLTAAHSGANPDPEGKIQRDHQGWIAMEVAVVPPEIRPGEAVRLHVELQPSSLAGWNNEADPTRLWLALPEGWKASSQLVQAPLPPQAESHETRRLEVELQSPSDLASGPVAITGYVLYHACHKETGLCQFLRQDFATTVRIRR